MAKRWKKEETTYLKRYGAKRTVQELAERFGVDAAAMRARLDETALRAADYPEGHGEPDPGVEPLEKGIQALYAKKYAQAGKLLEQAEEDAEQPDVANRARRYLAMVKSRMEGAETAADPYLEAVYERNQGNLEAALQICIRGGRQGKDDRFAHLAASIYALSGDVEKAAKVLETAIQLNPRNRVLAYHDRDFAALREDPAYADLFAAGD